MIRLNVLTTTITTKSHPSPPPPSSTEDMNIFYITFNDIFTPQVNGTITTLPLLNTLQFPSSICKFVDTIFTCPSALQGAAYTHTHTHTARTGQQRVSQKNTTTPYSLMDYKTTITSTISILRNSPNSLTILPSIIFTHLRDVCVCVQGSTVAYKRLHSEGIY